MSDQTYAQVIVYACPPEQHAAALTTLEWARNERPSLEAIKPDPQDARTWQFPNNPELVLGDRYGEDEMSLDAYEDIAADLIEAAPGAVFLAWVDPKYEYPGMLVMYSPTLGRFEATCDANGNVTPEPAALRRLAVAHDFDGILALMGDAWTQELNALRAQLVAATVAAEV